MHVADLKVQTNTRHRPVVSTRPVQSCWNMTVNNAVKNLHKLCSVYYPLLQNGSRLPWILREPLILYVLVQQKTEWPARRTPNKMPHFRVPFWFQFDQITSERFAMFKTGRVNFRYCKISMSWGCQKPPIHMLSRCSVLQSIGRFNVTIM